jgi:hypothetical protein
MDECRKKASDVGINGNELEAFLGLGFPRVI